MPPPGRFEDLADEQLLASFADVSRARADREASFHELARRHRHRIFAVCHRILGNAADAEDATQETLVKLARSAGGFRHEAQVSTWLYRVAHNVCTDRIRYEARRPSTPVDDITVVGPPQLVDDSSEAHATATLVGAALAQLDDRSRQLLLLVAVDGLTYTEAAEATGVAVGTVKSRISRARVRLGELLTEDAEDTVRPAATGHTPDAGAAPAERGPRGPPHLQREPPPAR